MSTTLKIRPLHDRLVVQRLEDNNVSKGGIVIPDTAKEKPSKGLVVAIGTGKPLDSGSTRNLTIKNGEKVLFGKYSGTEIKHDGQEYVVLREEDVLAVLED